MHSRAVVEFQRAAGMYRAEIEAAHDADGGAPYARRLRNAVARVYLAAALIDPAGFSGTDDDPPRVDTSRSRELEAAVRGKLGSGDEFLDVWDPTEPENGDPIRRSLSHELVEIYEDIGVALALMESADTQEPQWDIRERFESHWGKHAVDVLRPLHHLARLGVRGFDY